MNDRMSPLPFCDLMDWALADPNALFGVPCAFRADAGKTIPLFGAFVELPFGPAAGPHTQLAQNIIAAYAAGARFFELKTVQTLDGEDLPVEKPCIDAADEGYNVEWSTELTVPQAMAEYIKAWFAITLLSRELSLGGPTGFIFNMSVGYDLAGIASAKIDAFIEGLKNAGATPVFQACAAWARANLRRFQRVDAAYIDSLSPHICNSITVSTLHGCPPDEIERIAAYLLIEKGLHTFVKCNPTLLGYDFARERLDALGYDYLAFDGHHFRHDLRYEDAVPMFRRLLALAESRGLTFGVKLTNTFPVKTVRGGLPGGEMYMSGRPLFALATALAFKLSRSFDGRLRVSYSGGADAHNIAALFQAGVYPVTVATTLLKPGGYQRLTQMASLISALPYEPFSGADAAAIARVAERVSVDPYYQKPIKPLPSRKNGRKAPLLRCATAPCQGGCPIGQDVPAYLRLAGEGRYLDALRVIVAKNPLPSITGTLCGHRCGDRCRRNFYEETVHIRGVKRLVAERAMAELLAETTPPKPSGAKVAVVG
ncbi:MAG: putative selenate reductase subunit YgfK, partial [Firmicutes bacterium]|nr:putative selenate reductase subunit YgfK [Bacillota bacterium]